MKPRKNKHTKPFKKSVLIYCEGDTEKNYLDSLKADRYKGLSIKTSPDLIGSSCFKKGFKYIEQILTDNPEESYSLIFYVLDLDVIRNQGKTNEYKKAKAKLEQLVGTHDRLYVIESMPCIEFWFYLHYDDKDSLLINYEEAKKKLKAYLSDYEKTNLYSSRIYLKIKDKLATAIENSSKIVKKGNRVPGQEYSYTLMHEIIDKLNNIKK